MAYPQPEPCPQIVEVRGDALDPAQEAARLRSACGSSAAGALATFTGLVRDDPDPDGPLRELQLEHYPGMTEAALRRIAENAARRWNLQGVSLVHRHGTLRPGEPIVFCGVLAPHRAEAFEACAFLVDYLKTDAPFWKKEIRAAGARWVEARAGDQRARERWSAPPMPGD